MGINIYCSVKLNNWHLHTWLIANGLTFSNSTFCPHSVFMCFVWISEQTAIISLCNINWLVFITETRSVYCAVRSASLYIYVKKPVVTPCVYACRHNAFITSRYIELKLNARFMSAFLSHKRTFSCCSRHLRCRWQQSHLFMMLNTRLSIRSALFPQSFKSSYILSFEVWKEKYFFLSGTRKTSRAHKCRFPVAQVPLTYFITGCFIYGFPEQSYFIA